MRTSSYLVASWILASGILAACGGSGGDAGTPEAQPSSATAGAGGMQAAGGAGGAVQELPGAGGSAAVGRDGGTTPDDSQLPPTDAAGVTSWLAGGAYLEWTCEGSVHASRSPSPHGFNRICSNDAISRNAAGTEPWPAGAAGVKELYGSASDTTPTGYAVYVKTESDSGSGKNWYWYESLLPGAVSTSGFGARGCIGCHGTAGEGPSRTPSTGGRDYVFTPVR